MAKKTTIKTFGDLKLMNPARVTLSDIERVEINRKIDAEIEETLEKAGLSRAVLDELKNDE